MIHPADKAAGKILREKRLLAGMTQVQVAEQINLSFQQLQKYETGLNRLSISRATELAQVIGFDPAELFKAKEGPNSASSTPDDAAMLRHISSLPDHLKATLRTFVLSLPPAPTAA